MVPYSFCFDVCRINVSAPSSVAKPRKFVKYISELNPYKLYAFQVEAVVLKNDGAKSDLAFIMTKESSKCRKLLNIP